MTSVRCPRCKRILVEVEGGSFYSDHKGKGLQVAISGLQSIKCQCGFLTSGRQLRQILRVMEGKPLVAER
ncbi:MAG: hypothetical protein C4551_10205 [Bacillota bacterium]|nr:MAG: hypothetical protein C4551_10205 [Bacillota bacterium]